MRPGYVAFRVRTQDGTTDSAAVIDAVATYWTGASAPPERPLAVYYQHTVSGVLGQSRIAPGSWHLVQFRDIDWRKRTLNVYIDCQLIAVDVPFGVAEALSSFNLTAWGLTIDLDDVGVK